MPTLSIVIPTRHFSARLQRLIGDTLRIVPAAEVIVVEPRSASSPADARIAALQSTAAAGPVRIRRLWAPAGRGPQCNAGAAAAAGELLLFLHDDTRLPIDARALICRTFRDPAIGAATFRLRFDTDHPLLRLYGYFSRFESVLTTFGDQGIVVRRHVLQALGGFPDWPLFEDVELTRRLRRHTKLVKLPAAVTTSAVRFRRNGMLRQQLLNGWLLALFLTGTPAQQLATRYEREPGRDRAQRQ
ncbi:MAG: glycosyltransferase family 2 protein [Thiohalocapsa sp.]|nr:glycosyltransferase family 2 protein [Thiohalocapsa sp.]